MKTFNLLTQFLLVLSTLLLCNAFNTPSQYIKELEDNKRDIENFLNFENVDGDIKFNGKRALDVYYNKSNTTELKPVYVFFFGGIWYSGDKVKATKFGQLFENNDYVAVVPNYILFPYGGFDDMVDDVYKALIWTFKNIEKYGGDPKRVSLSGYSSGAHLSALTLFKTVLGYENKNQSLEKFPELEKVVLVSGPYDFDDYSFIRKLFGTETEDSIFEKFIKLVTRSKNVSPTDLFKPFPDNSFSSLGAKKFVFFYGSADKSVPETSATNLMNQMKRVCPDVNIEYVYKEGYEHTTLPRGVRAGEVEQEEIYFSLINM